MHDLPEFFLPVSEIPCGEQFNNKKDHKMDENDADESHERFLQIHPRVQVDLWCTGEYFTKKSIFCQGPRQQLSFFAEEIFGIFKLKIPYFWTICDKNA